MCWAWPLEREFLWPLKPLERWSLERDLWSSNLGLVKSHTMLSTTRHCCNISSSNICISWVPYLILVIDPKSESVENKQNFNVEKKENEARLDQNGILPEKENKDFVSNPDIASSEKINKKVSLDKRDGQKIVLPDPPLKSALKKPKIPSPSETDLDDDTSTVISASTITSAQLKRANVRRKQKIILITRLFPKLPWPGDSEEDFSVFMSSCHLPTCLPTR